VLFSISASKICLNVKTSFYQVIQGRNLERFAFQISLMTPTGFEPVIPPWKGGVLTAWPRGLDNNSKNSSLMYEILTGGEQGIWTLETAQTAYTISNRAPSATRTALQLAPQVGFEPTTDRLTADCSTTELLRNNTNDLCAMHLVLYCETAA
jgi:hypothetical protein